MKKINLITDFDIRELSKQEGFSEESEIDIYKSFLTKKPSDFVNIDNIKDVPQIFDQMPEGYINNVAHRGNYSEAEMDETLEDGTRKILHLDIDFGKVCRLNCPHCFKNNKEIQKVNENELSPEKLKEAILNFKKLGLKNVKITGAGEPFDNKDFFPFLKFLYENGLGISVFTKGYVIGNDIMVKKLYGEHGINDGAELAQKLKELDVGVLLSFNSFDKELQIKYSGAEKMYGYVDFRDKALVNLINAGLNEYKEGEPTRLAMIMAPMKPENLDEVIKIYAWARMRNIYPVGCPSNEAGKGNEENKRVEDIAPDYLNDLMDVYADIYIWNIDHGITSLDRLKQEGISLYPGSHPCTQSRAGGYLTISGKMISCPGHDINREELTISSDVSKETDYSLMRKNSLNYQRTGFNQKCIARDGSTLPLDFYDKIMEKVKLYYQK